MLQRLLFLVKTFLLTLAAFMLAKAAFMAANSADHPFTTADVADVVTHGLSLDASTALYFLFLPLLVAMVSVWVGGRWAWRVVKGYFAVASTAMALAFVADTSLYPFWGFKLNSACLQYLTTPTEAMASVTAGYMAIRLVAVVAIATLLYIAYTRPRMQFPTGGYRGVETVAWLATVPLLIIGVRGGVSESTTNIGQVYYTQNQFLNHAAVNPVFSFMASFEKSANQIVDYDFMPQAECDRWITALYPEPTDTVSTTDTLLTTRRPDIVVVLMESAGEMFAPFMPRLQQLKRQGVSFSRCYANSWRTDRGTVCTYSGYPSFPTSSVMKMPSKTRHLPNMAAALRAEGYQTTYLYGGDINFTNMRSYLIAGGFEQLISQDDFTADERKSAKWGVRDDITFQTLFKLITTPHGQPQLIGYSTLSSHEPWDVPIHAVDDKTGNAFCYLDQCIGNFIDRLRQTPQWQHTLVILLPDHSIDYHGNSQADSLRNLIPMVWTGGAVACHRDIDRICNQTDLVATLLGQMGISHSNFRWSRDVMNSQYRQPLAMHTWNNGYSLTDSTGFFAYDLGAQHVIANQSTDGQRLEKIGKAILQATTLDLKSNR